MKSSSAWVSSGYPPIISKLNSRSLNAIDFLWYDDVRSLVHRMQYKILSIITYLKRNIAKLEIALQFHYNSISITIL